MSSSDDDSSSSYKPGDFEGNLCDAVWEVTEDHDYEFNADKDYEAFKDQLLDLVDFFFTQRQEPPRASH